MHFAPPLSSSFPPEVLGEWGRVPWPPRGHQNPDHLEKPLTCVEAGGCLGGPVLRACGPVGIAEGSAEVVLLRGRGVVCGD